jgi:hypothetical protein
MIELPEIAEIESDVLINLIIELNIKCNVLLKTSIHIDKVR